MPAFLFIAGFALALSNSNASRRHRLLRALRRAAILILLSQIVLSLQSGHFYLQFHNILAHLGFCSLVGFLLLELTLTAQINIAAAILLLHYALYLCFHSAGLPFAPGTNFGSALDRFLMGHNYSDTPAVNLDLLPEIVNLMAGLWLARLFLAPCSQRKK